MISFGARSCASRNKSTSSLLMGRRIVADLVIARRLQSAQLQPVQRRLPGHRRAILAPRLKLAGQHRHHRIVAQFVVVVEVLIAERDPEHPLAEQGHHFMLEQVLAPLIVQATLSFSTAVLDAAALGFLGMGAQPPTPEWGTMLAEAREFILRAWWVVTFPGLAILLTVLAINLVGDGLRDALDPKMKRS